MITSPSALAEMQGKERERGDFKQLKRAYGFEEVAIVPGQVTMNPKDAEIGLTIGDRAVSYTHLTLPTKA